MKKAILIGLAVMAVVLVGAGCKVAYTESAVTGEINGEAFTFVDGYCEDDGTVRMYAEAKDFSTSTSFTTSYPYVMMTLPSVAVGEYELSFKLLDLLNSWTVTGVDSNIVNVIFTDGYVEITAVTDTTVTGGMYIESGDDLLNGTFTLERVDW